MVDPTEISARESVRRVFANPNLRRVQLAFFGSLLGDWAYATAVTVWAFSVGGATAVGVFMAVRFIAVALAGPLGAAVADRVSRRTFMMATDAIRAVLVCLAALAVAFDTPPMVVYLLAIAAAMVGAPFRAAQAGLIPKLVKTPDELTSSNAVAANLENVVVFLGPALGALLVSLTNVQVVFWFNVATYLWSLALVAAIRVPVPLADVKIGSPAADQESGHPPPEGVLRELTAGFAALGKDRDLAVVASLAAAQGLVWGALTVFLVIVSIEMLDAGAAGVGYLNSIMGVGTIVGGMVILSRTTKRRLARDMNLGVLGWSLPLLLLAAFPSPVTAVIALAIIGLMDPWVNVGLDTLPQRLAPDRLLSRVFQAVDSSLIAAMSLGAFAAPALVHWLGFRGAMAFIGSVVTIYALTTLRTTARLDARLREPAHLGLLRSVSLFAPLSLPVTELLAHKLSVVVVPAGGVVVREGDPSDCVYVVVSGEVEVTQAGRVLRTETAGDIFGEIGLLRDVPRTATVTAVVGTELVALGREDFLTAVTGQQEARIAAEEVVSRRLGV